VSVSLNAADPQTYDRLCQPIYAKAFRAVLAFTRACVAAGLDTAMTVVDHPDIDVEACAALRIGSARPSGCGAGPWTSSPGPADSRRARNHSRPVRRSPTGG